MVKKYISIGLMSGTSLDGMDCVLLEHNATFHRFKVLGRTSKAFSKNVKQMILKNCNTKTSAIHEISDLNIYLADFAAHLVDKALKKYSIKKQDVSVLGFHGQTLHHLPNRHSFLNEKNMHSTLQIGDGPYLAALSGIPVVNNFRTKDLVFGGDGAPLVPYAHKIFFSKKKKNTLVVNLGGICNFTYLGQKRDLAFDIGPCNMLLDSLVQNLFEKSIDKNGKLAKKGRSHREIVSSFLKDSYFAQRPPKSTGREQFGQNYTKKWLQKAKKLKLSEHDVLASATTFITQIIFLSYKKFVKRHGVDQLILCGGGTFHKELCLQITQVFEADSVMVRTSQDFSIHPQDVEAASFAILGFLALNKKVNQIGKLTGSKKDLSLGQVSYPN